MLPKVPYDYYAIVDDTIYDDPDRAIILSMLPFPETLESARNFQREVWPHGVLVSATTWLPIPEEPR